ncbi:MULTISPECIES: hypothetical protein [unclassified Streptomyces]|uniref:hypothetical protein n=1 Tax=unclassified Streptomyces TaxID=2593676 RepID=UPI002DDB4736|nr:hypothetical protein [Streptomyces sp. NBC_01750]WSB00722.1 hypothetical protein OIE54_16280 [Streptomyces sp. NBC_01794]WSD34921.1 hypothetical protein OG966_25330 [Streptomyces sp. NBC_01750]
MRKTLVTGALGFVIAAGSLTVAPTASAGESDAQAPQCNLWKSNSAPYTGYAWCKGRRPTSIHRVKVTCVDPRGSQRIVWGPPRRSEQTSAAKCSDNPNVGILKVSVAYVD